MSDVQTFRIPGNPYEGAPIFSARSADGAVYFVYSGVRPGTSTFSQQVAVWRNGVWSWIDVPNAWQARPSATVEADGLYVTYASSDNVIRRWKVPGFVSPLNQLVADVVWSKTPDAVYADLQAKGGIYGMIVQIVQEQIKQQDS